MGQGFRGQVRFEGPQELVPAFPAGPRRADRFRPCSRRARARANSTNAFPPSWTASTSAAGSAGCSSSRCRRQPRWACSGLIAMLALAIPAFRETSDEDWLKKSELAVQFLDRYGNPIGNRGIKHNDSIPLEEFPDHLIKATLATEDRRFYEHFGIDLGGTFRALLTNARAGGVVQGGSSISQQLAKEPVPVERAHHRAQGQGGVPGDLAGIAADQERDPEALSRPRLSWAAAPSASTAPRISISTSRRAT